MELDAELMEEYVRAKKVGLDPYSEYLMQIDSGWRREEEVAHSLRPNKMCVWLFSPTVGLQCTRAEPSSYSVPFQMRGCMCLPSTSCCCWRRSW